jgi:flagellar protein FliO/FliZ
MARHRFLLPLFAAFALGLAALPVSAAEPTPASLGDDGVIYPRNSPEARHQRASDSSFPVWGMLGVIAVLAGTGFYLVKRGHLGSRGSAVDVRQRLAIEETRALGNKQFLAVAAYGERKVLLSVCPGRIDFLCRLDDGPVPSASPSVETSRRETIVG